MLDKEMAEALAGVSFLIGDKDTVEGMPHLAALEPFDRDIMNLLNDVSRILIADRQTRVYPDVVTFAFWIRRASLLSLKERFYREDGNIHLGRGVAFHIAPSNVPVNFAYSLASGLLTGNANIVRVPSKDFPQVSIVTEAFVKALKEEKNQKLAGYVCLVRYERQKTVNDVFSSIADTRVIWGGDATVEEIRRSPLAPRAGEITFADRFSIAVIDSNAYIAIDDKERVAEDFYNDTYLTDQNACTSPRLVVWMGNRQEEAKEEFWGKLHELVVKKYAFQPIQGVNKLTSTCLVAVAYQRWEEGRGDNGQKNKDNNHSGKVISGIRIEPHMDNLLVRVKLPNFIDGLMDMKDNSGYFFEYDCEDIMELKELCKDSRCQTIAYIGDVGTLRPLLMAGIRGIDRVVPVGRTMDFDLVWDGYDLYSRLTRTVTIG